MGESSLRSVTYRTHQTLREGRDTGLGEEGAGEHKWEDTGEPKKNMGEIIELVCCQFYTFPGKIMSKDRNLLAICWLTFPMVITLCGRSSVLYIYF